ncbi:MAG TPA: HemK/PrmC family methyltransferase [Verrucomicrobiae bacterium]|nr:HemK/PrmC family methyltransferase [Verrucomicrobiae bacterium]
MKSSEKPISSGDWLRKSERILREVDIITGHLECLVLLQDITRKDRAWLLAHPEFSLTTYETTTLDHQITERARHIPLAYIRGHTEFYGREFLVDKYTLVPRPETETMVELLSKIVASLKIARDIRIADIGTGSGAIAITAKLAFPKIRITATDIDERCLRIARENADRFKAPITFLRGDLLKPIAKSRLSFTALLCNLPYVPDGFAINKAATHEPRQAIFGGNDGLDYYRRLFAETSTLSTKPLYVFTESLPTQHELLTGVANSASYELWETDDFIQCFQYSQA